MASSKTEKHERNTEDQTSQLPETLYTSLPWSEPAYITGAESPYYNSAHARLRAYIRHYVDENILPHQVQWEAAGEAPRQAAKDFARTGIPFLDVPREYRPEGFRTVAGIPVEKLDAFHWLVVTDELYRIFTGVMVSLVGGSGIGVPPIINHGTEAQKRMWLPGLFTWKTSFCLGITEPSGGSDVSNIRTTAKKTPDGGHYIVNGFKKWITGAPYATHMTTAVRTGGPGLSGISLLVIPLDAPGITIRRISNSGQAAGGASYITLMDVLVPVDHLLGTENRGFPLIMTNFNKERLNLAVGCNRMARTCLSAALAYSLERETFGKALVERGVIRLKMTEVARRVEAHWAWIEQIVWHVHRKGWGCQEIAGRTALCKVSGGKMLELAAREGQQVLGGNGYVRGGVGAAVEQISRDLRMMVVGGGSEEIMGELAFREEMKGAKRKAREAKI